jgi:acetyl-CoA synthetase
MEQYREMHKKSIELPAQFWSEIAAQFHWETPYDVDNFCSYNFDVTRGPVKVKWMEGATTNVCYNLLDKNVRNGMGDKVAFYW